MRRRSRNDQPPTFSTTPRPGARGAAGAGGQCFQAADQAVGIGGDDCRAPGSPAAPAPSDRTRCAAPGIAAPTARSACSLPCARPRRRARAATVRRPASGWRCACWSSSMTRAAEAKNGSNRVMSLRTSSISCGVARGVRAVRLVDQQPSIGGAVEHHRLPPRRGRSADNRRTRSSRPGANAAARSGDRHSRAAARSLSVSWNCDAVRPTLPVASAPSQRCMSSLRMSARVRPKSPPLQPPSARRTACSQRDGSANRSSGSEGTSPACRASCDQERARRRRPRRRSLFRSAAVAGFVGVTLDPDDGQDQDGSHAFAWSAIDG